MENFQSLYDLLNFEQVRRLPDLYLRKKSVSDLFVFISGYHLCGQIHGFTEATEPPFWMFFHWVMKRLEHNGSYHNWDGMLLEAAAGDEDAALNRFFEEFDLFQTLSVSRHALIQPDEKAQAYFIDHLNQTRPDLINHPNKPGPATELEVYSYAPDFGCALYERRVNTLAWGNYFTSENELNDWMMVKYGIAMDW